ncbi:MAG: DUF309 domain-containing protein [Acidobacteria bacterium]|nr:DUF309 domain-containing protein [Acidobacteriota bacterium]
MFYTKEHQALYPKEYFEGIDLFNKGKYWHAHEAWEHIWKESKGEKKLFYQGLIQVAAALFHYEKNNARGAHLCINNALKKLETLPSPYMSLELKSFTKELRNFLADVLETSETILGENLNLTYPLIVLQE